MAADNTLHLNRRFFLELSPAHKATTWTHYWLEQLLATFTPNQRRQLVTVNPTDSRPVRHQFNTKTPSLYQITHRLVGSYQEGHHGYQVSTAGSSFASSVAQSLLILDGFQPRLRTLPADMSQLPALAPRPPGETPSLTDRQNSKEHTEREWEAHREIIERLYIDENRKLADTMTIMVSKHGFAATEQMYKKRLKKWNVRKRAYRKVPDSPVASTPAPVSDHTSASPMEVDLQHQTPNYGSQPVCTTIARTTRFGPYAGLELILDTVRSWSLCKLESSDAAPDPMVRYLANPNQPPIQDSRTMYRTFELVFDLWCHGKGQLAGMAARKAFYILEFVLTEDHPDLIWHMLDTIYDMVDRGHIQLLGMFLAHASQLSRRCLPREHPLVKILEQLIKCDYQSQEGREQVCYLLRTAWLRNVDILSDHVGSLASKHLWLYEQLIWDGRTRLRKECELARIQGTMTTALTDLHRHTDADSPVGKLDRLRIMALMLEYTQMDIGDRQKAEKLAIDLLNHTSEGEQGSRSNARFHAYARKMLARLQEHRQDWAQAEENLRYAVEKRETAHGTGTDLRVIRDMWVLAGHYQRAGKGQVADQIVFDAISRAELYLGRGAIECT